MKGAIFRIEPRWGAHWAVDRQRTDGSWETVTFRSSRENAEDFLRRHLGAAS